MNSEAHRRFLTCVLCQELMAVYCWRGYRYSQICVQYMQETKSVYTSSTTSKSKWASNSGENRMRTKSFRRLGLLEKACVSAGLLILIGPSAHGATIFSDFGSGQTFTGPSATVSQSNQWVAAAFQPSQSANLDTVDLGFILFQPSDSFTLQIMTDSSGHPGTLLDSINFSTGLALGTPGIVTVASSLHPALLAGTTYWLVALGGNANAQGGWEVNNQSSVLGGWSISSDQGTTWVSESTSVMPAFDVSGTPTTASSVPEPYTFGSMAIGLLLGGFMRTIQRPSHESTL